MAGNDDDSDGIQGWGAEAAQAPSPIPGMDWQTFRNFVGRALNGDETVPAAIRTRVNAALHDGETDLGSKDRRWCRTSYCARRSRSSSARSTT